MPPSVPPPEPPRIVQIQQQKAVNHFADAARLAIASNSRSSLEQQKSNLNSEFSNSAIQQFLSSASNPDSPVYKDAAKLGAPISVGVPSRGYGGQGDKGTQTAEEQRSRGERRRGDAGIRGRGDTKTIPIKNLQAPMPEPVSQATRLQMQARDGERRTFELTTSSRSEIVQTKPESDTEASATEIKVTADQLEYDEQQRVITASGDVLVRFPRGVLSAKRVQVSLANRMAVAQGNVVLKRGEQVLRGARFRYNFVRDSGVILNARGEIYQPTAERDFSPTLPGDVGAGTLVEEPIREVTPQGGYQFDFGGGRNLRNLPTRETEGGINRLRFQAERVEFGPESLQASDVRITNDPFSPPELELQADTATFTRIGPLQSEITTTDSRIVFDQGLSLPIFQNRIVLDRRERDPSLVSFGYDGEERGGFFAERTLGLVETEGLRFQVTPQYFIQRAVSEEGVFDPSSAGVEAELEGTISPRTNLEGTAELTSLDFGEFEDELRASLQIEQLIGDRERPYLLNLEYSYRDRFFNGSLGYQTVQSSLGAVFTSPGLSLGETGINLRYQGGIQRINAETDQDELLSPGEDDDRVSLTRYQGAAYLSRGFSLWEGETLPPTPTEGLRYTPVPVQPSLRLATGVTGIASAYSNGDTQNSLSATIGLQGQLGQFSRSYLDYTAFNLRYTQAIRVGESPFLFDRFVDESVLEAGITQQIYGPFLAGFQTRLDLEENEEISTDYFVEYSRRTYSVLLRYNPALELGSIGFRVNGFNWEGSAEPFEGTRSW
ncbi:MAG: DUF3769 domain-containing protein [Cyanobacteria bacterium QS_5_48_63]|nr:MAG: DUF3769 domain-containing protein [Cyanobacteria bacterium QS_5_48_63]